MTLKNIVKTLQGKGVKVEYYTRKDGSIRITRLNGATFSPKRSTGNIAARAMLGQSLSPRKRIQQERQLAGITARRPKKNVTYAKRPRKSPLSKEIRNAIKRVQRLAKKNRTGDEKYATVTTRTVRAHLEEMGEEKTLRHLSRLELHFKGLAYPEAILALADRLMDAANKTGSPELAALAVKVRKSADLGIIKESALQAVLAKLYDVEHEINVNPTSAPAQIELLISFIKTVLF